MLQGAGRNLVPYLTVRENVEFAAAQARRLGAEVASVDQGLELVGAADFADAPLAQLSQGQLQMAALAVAMAPSPGVLLADEPTGSLDFATGERSIANEARPSSSSPTTPTSRLDCRARSPSATAGSAARGAAARSMPW